MCCLLWLSDVRAQAPAYPDSLYDIQDSLSVPVANDQVVIATVVRLKSHTQRLPAVLFYTTYFQGPRDINFAKRSADRGYLGVLVYARGIRGNLAHYMPYEHEKDDLYPLIDWIATHAWCDGKVAMMGGSYTGFSQWAATKKLHPALKTIVPQVAVMPGMDVPMENNVQLNQALYWPNDNIFKRKPLPRELPFQWFESGTAFSRLDSLAGITDSIFGTWMAHPSYDAYWKQMVPTPQEFASIHIPVLTTTGYYDGAQLAAIAYVKKHYAHNSAADHYVVIGPYDHWGGQRQASKELMGYTIDPVAEQSMQELAYQWIDHILKGKEKPALLKDRFNFQVMGANKWIHAPTMAGMANDTLHFYLQGQKLATKLQKQQTISTLTVDMKDRTKEHGFFVPSLIQDSLDASNGLMFVSDPFAQDLVITDAFFGNLQLTVNKKDADLSLALFEQTADGKYFFITRYLGRASYAKDPAKRQLLEPGKKTSLPIGPTRIVCKQIAKGSRLLLIANTNKHPFEIINYGSGKVVADETIQDAGEPMVIRWHHTSRISIPVRR